MNRRSAPHPRSNTLISAAVYAAVLALLAVAAMWPIYQTARLCLVAGVGSGISVALIWLGRRYRWGSLTILVLAGAFILTVVPVAVPSAFSAGVSGLLHAERDALAAVALGWKQILTLTLPLSTYQNVLVPAYLLCLAASALGSALVFNGGRLRPLAAFPALLPVLFGTFFGSAAVSEPVRIGPLHLLAPRETLLWVLSFAAVALWIGWVSGAERRAALRRGRSSATTASDVRAIRRGAVTRAVAGGLTLFLAVGAGAAAAPLVDSEKREVPRDRIDPEIVIREQVSPLASYRTWKRDEAYDAPLFTVSADRLPTSLRFAVLDHFDGVDFTVGEPGAAGRYTRLPSVPGQENTTPVQITIASGYESIWAPIAPLGAPPEFAGPRAEELSDAFFFNREAGAAVALPTEAGLTAGDAYAAPMVIDSDTELRSEPASSEPLIELARYPQLQRWLELQGVSPGPGGLTRAIDRLRARGYLSHSLADEVGQRRWLEALQSRHGTRFISSPGGHSATRVEQLFSQLSDQEETAGEGAGPEDLVAGIGDDEQFAAAAALLARALGYESRVVVGVRLGDTERDGVPGIPACSSECQGRHVSAWVEVKGADEVWVPLAVTPQVEIPPTLIQQGEQLPEFATQPEERDAEESDPPVGDTERESADRTDTTDTEDPAEQLLRTIALVTAAIVLLALPLAFLPVAKRIRTRRRRSQTPAELSVLSAWAELEDSYRDSGEIVPRGGSRSDIAAALDVPHGQWLAQQVDRAVFAPEGVSEEDAQQVWQTVTDDLRARRKERGPMRAITAAYSLRSLGLPRRRPARKVRTNER